MISYRVDYDDKQVSALFKRLEDDMPEINQRVLGVLAEDVTGKAIREHIVPQFKHPTGKLAQSTAAGIHLFDGYATVGTNISYGAYHEFGFHGVQQVSSHTRHTKVSDVLVRAHSRRVDYDGRPFMRPALGKVFETGRAVELIERTLKDEIEKRERAN